jgi:peptidyl-tRNA hydrolase, PTH2 family
MSINTDEMKQCLIWQGSLSVRKGKVAAQIAHASLKAILDSAFKEDHITFDFMGDCQSYTFRNDSYIAKWLSGIFTKIVVKVNSEEELIKLYNDVTEYNYRGAHKDGEFQPIPVALIKDAGLTEFHGVPTLTCMAVGPAPIELVNKFTGHLKLL